MCAGNFRLHLKNIKKRVHYCPFFDKDKIKDITILSVMMLIYSLIEIQNKWKTDLKANEKEYCNNSRWRFW